MHVSIVTPSYNQGSYIRHTIDSVLRQSYTNVELLVMDGGSTDETVPILENYPDPRLIWVSEPDNGQTHAINKGMQQTKGEILAYLNSDDIYLEGTLEFVANYFAQHPEVDVLHGNCITIDEAGKDRGVPITANAFSLRGAFTKRWRIPQPATFWRRRVADAVGLFDETLHYVMDYDYWLRMILAGFRPTYVNRDLAGFRFHGDSKTVSQAEKFYHDWQHVLNKIYTRPDLPPEIALLRPLSYAYIDYYGAEIFWKQNEKWRARPYLKKIISSGGPLRLKTLASVMLVDSYAGTPFSDLLKTVYRGLT